MDDGQDTDQVERIVASVLAGRKYRNVCPDTVRRFATQEWAKRRAVKEATKATRSRLHQAYAAYESRVDYQRAYHDLEAAYAEGTLAAVRAACQRVLALHASTRERLPVLDRLYAEVFERTGVPGVLLDLACGLNPLSLPWMGLSQGAAYYAYDIDGERIAFLDRYLSLAGAEAHTFFQDILHQPPVEQGDVAFLFKSSSCLERQQAGATLALLDALRVHHVVVTFPTYSLGRRERGMPAHYERSFLDMISGRPWPVARLRLETELVFVVAKSPTGQA
jgi:16S rRNA (guanine(1405)-N(7))-methyltransferase